MNALKEIRKEHLEDYDRTYKEIGMHDRIIQKYREEWNKVNNKPRPLTLDDSYKEQYLKQEFQTYKRVYEEYYENLRRHGEEVSYKIILLNIQLGYEETDLYSDEE